MKKRLYLITAVILVLAFLLSACSTAIPTPTKDTSPSESTVDAAAGKEPETETEEDLSDPSGLPSLNDAEDVKYVMIYNPELYDEYSDYNPKKVTGTLRNQIDPSLSRAGELEEEPGYSLYTQPQVDLTKYPELDLSGNRADAFYTPYSVGETHEFWSGLDTDNRDLSAFECAYAGDNVNVWRAVGENLLSDSKAESIGKEFDDTIFDTCVDLFGEPRFVDNGHKLNILVYDFQTTSGVVGFFYMLDLFSSVEIPEEYVEIYQLNTDHAIINVNAALIGSNYEDKISSTVAHEFQHLINFSACLDSGECISGTWLNESFSGFIEDYIYPGCQNPDRYYALAYSDLIRYGQSLYNFYTESGMFSQDIGVYGSVFLFSTYLEKIAGEGVFRKTVDYWRRDRALYSDAESIYLAFPEDARKTIDNSIKYPSSISAGMTEEEEWLSKLTLNFYISLLKFDDSDPGQYEPLDPLTLLYDQINEADIEGGGRIIVAVKGDKFEIPEDADEGLVYIGFDKDFNVITAPTFG